MVRVTYGWRVWFDLAGTGVGKGYVKELKRMLDEMRAEDA